jgi:diadenosine tetraphosphatase ApaH/serine/threonine PP2A family protein phosphatase
MGEATRAVAAGGGKSPSRVASLRPVKTGLLRRPYQFGSEEILRLAIFADIHANRPAFAACLQAARARGAERIVCLGDIVGYGADPEWALDTVMELAAAGAPVVLGNHDHAIADLGETMNSEAQAAIEWTRGRLSAPQRQFLAGLPLTVAEDTRLYVHSEASNPPRWRYVREAADAGRSMIATSAHVTFCGHIHRPALYSMSSTAKMTSFVPVTGVPVQLTRGRQWLAVLGSVGQPRDGNPAASFVMFDTDRNEITWCRAPYDIADAADRIRANGLPPWLADRLFRGI